MATEAEGYRTEFEAALTQYGQWVTHRRAPYRNDSGEEVSGFERPLRILDLIPATLMSSNWRSGGLTNLGNPDDRDQWYASGRADVWEGDTITLRIGAKTVYTLTLCKPFVVDDTIVIWVMTAKRDRQER